MRRLLIALLATAFLGLVGCGGGNETGTVTSKQRPTFDEAVSSRLGAEGEISLELALSMFEAAYGPLPGADVDALPSEGLHAGTFALNAVRAHWDELTPGQRDAVHALALDPEDEVYRTVLWDPALGGSPPTSGGPALAKRAPSQELCGPRTVPCSLRQSVVDTAEAAIRALQANLGRTLRRPVIWAVTTRRGNVLADTAPTTADGLTLITDGNVMQACQVTVHLGAIASNRELHSTVRHELFHCFQYEVTTRDSAPWIDEGQAAWVEATLDGDPGIAQSRWRRWLTTPSDSLFTRIYDAIGFYAVLDQHGVNPWSVIDDMLRAGSTTGSQAAYVAATGARSSLFPSYTASVLARARPLGEFWESHGPLITNDRSTRTVSLRPGGGPRVVEGDLATYGTTAIALDAVGEVLDLKVYAPAGAIGVTGAGTERITGDQLRRYCLAPGGCPPCPEGGPPPGPTILTARPGPAAVAVADQGTPSSRFRIVAAVYRVRDLCDEEIGSLAACDLHTPDKVTDAAGRSFRRNDRFAQGPTGSQIDQPGTTCVYTGDRHVSATDNDTISVSVTKGSRSSQSYAAALAYLDTLHRPPECTRNGGEPQPVPGLGNRATYQPNFSSTCTDPNFGSHVGQMSVAEINVLLADVHVRIWTTACRVTGTGDGTGNLMCTPLHTDPRAVLLRLAQLALEELRAAGRGS